MTELELEQRCRLAYLAGIRDHEERSGRPLADDELRRALARYPDGSADPVDPRLRIRRDDRLDIGDALGARPDT